MSGSRAGNILTINGNGFHDNSDNLVYYTYDPWEDHVPCNPLSITPTEITCLTEEHDTSEWTVIFILWEEGDWY